MGVIVGAALSLALMELVNNLRWDRICLCIGYALQMLNFFHGKIAALDDEDYTRILMARLNLVIFDYVCNMLIVSGMALTALWFANPRYVVYTNIAVRLCDLVLVFAVWRVHLSPLVRRAHISWALVDATTIVFWLVIIFTPLQWADQNFGQIVGITFLSIAALEILIAYTLNRKLYFHSPNNWSKSAQFWDKQQGEDGDEYRTSMIIPALLEKLDPLEGRRVLDLGTGNGCVARAFRDSGAKVTGVDSSEEMIELAKIYDAQLPDTKRPIDYRVHDLRSNVRLGEFDICISVFSHQDIDFRNLDHIFTVAGMNLVPGGTFVLVFDDLAELEDVGEHTTMNRHWLDRKRGKDNCRTQLVYWNWNEAGTSQNVTRAHIWTAEAHKIAADNNSFTVKSETTILCPKKPDTPALRLYQSKPNFKMLVAKWEGQDRDPGRYNDKAMNKVRAQELHQDTAGVLARVERGEEIDITKRGTVIARLVPVRPHPLTESPLLREVAASYPPGRIPHPPARVRTDNEAGEPLCALRDEEPTRIVPPQGELNFEREQQ